MFNIKPFVQPVIKDVEVTQLVYLVVFVLELLRQSDLPWEEVFFNCVSGFTIPSPITKGEFMNIAVFDLRIVEENAIIFACCNEDWSEYTTHYRFDFIDKTWSSLSTTYTSNSKDFYYLTKFSMLCI